MFQKTCAANEKGHVVVRVVAEVPPGMSLTSLRELLEMNEVAVHGVSRVDNNRPAPPHKIVVHLTPAELRVLRAFAHCNTYQHIANQLGTSVSTVRSHAKRIFEKLNVSSRALAIGHEELSDMLE